MPDPTFCARFGRVVGRAREPGAGARPVVVPVAVSMGCR